jgi:hypothetical protein
MDYGRNQAFYSMSTKGKRFFLRWGVKQPKREVDVHSQSGAKVKKEGSYRPTSSHRESLQGVEVHLYLQFS